ncbi:MAG: cyclic nucleotide-binding domain-containing protein [Lachnospiraceae bacterium]|nr:cyclic nucleotide-binding domain-containing protein [Lachnospiraceae bacterium]
MALTIKMNGINHIPKGEILFEAGMEPDGVFALVKGKATLMNPDFRITISSGDFLGLSDLYAGKRLLTCIAAEDMTVYAFPAKTTADIPAILDANSEYGGRVTASLGRYITELFARENTYAREAKQLSGEITDWYSRYCTLCKTEQLRAAALPETAKEAFVPSKMPKWLEYCLESAKIPADVQKSYFSFSRKVVLRHIEEQAGICRDMLAECTRQGDFIRRQGAVLVNGGADNLFFFFCALENAAKSEEAKKAAAALRDSVGNKLNTLTDLFEKYAGVPFEAHEKRREARKQNASLPSVSEEPCENALEQILSYAGVSEKEAVEYTGLLQKFTALEDKSSTEDEVRRLKKQLTEGFYNIYEAVFKKTYKKEEREIPQVIRLFLDFGLLDEKMITRTQLLELEKFVLEPVDTESTGCHIFTVREWLTWVYEGKREPSKNEFDQEYVEMLRELRKNGEITEKEEAEKLKDKEERLHYEVQNLFRYNHRLVNGQLSSFVPFLYGEFLTGSLERTFLSKQSVLKSLNWLRSLDYSLFYREFLYMNKELGIEKEYRVAEVLPDIILFPTLGTKSVMWQDISCRHRDTPGRFLLPLLSEVPVDDLMVRASGRYRWELCRTIQGTAWNNIQIKSLTSEYTDYLMYYKKNRDLSEERKEKVKTQLQKGKNNFREVYAMDYEAWIKYESAGAFKLNKVAREILATYCPFDAKIRAQLAQQPAFEEAMARFGRERAKKIRETELRNHALIKNGVELPKELLDTIAYYKEH